MKNAIKKLKRLIKPKAAQHVKLYQQEGATYLLDERKDGLRILFCSLPSAIRKGLQETPQAFSNQGLALEFYRVLVKLKYHVDVIDWDAEEIPGDIATQKYHAIILHGGVSTSIIKKAFGQKQKYLYFATGSYWKFHNAAERKRLRNYNLRHNTELGPDRLILHPEEPALEVSESIIVLGNEVTRKTYSKFANVHSLECATYNQPRLHESFFNHKDPKSILFFSGNGNIHKGLDLLIEAALELVELNLHVCTGVEASFLEVYGDALTKAKNIHIHGFTPQDSKLFRRLVRKCGYVCLPSCSEGSPGSVIDCMAYGLVPIVTPAAGIHNKQGYLIEQETVRGVKEVLSNACNVSKGELINRSRAVAKEAATNYSPEEFRKKLTNILEQVL